MCVLQPPGMFCVQVLQIKRMCVKERVVGGRVGGTDGPMGGVGGSWNGTRSESSDLYPRSGLPVLQYIVTRLHG